MSQYYYAVAALPLLSYEGDSVRMEIDKFLEFCSDWLDAKDYQLLMEAGVADMRHPDVSSPILKKWLNWESELRNALVRLRAAKKGEEITTFIEPGETVLGIEEKGREAFIQESPLTAEDMLNRARWNYLEELESGHYFDIGKLLVYYLKLQLLDRKARFSKEAGMAKYTEIFSKITDYNVLDVLNK